MSHVDDSMLHAYLDGALEAGERDDVDAHLADCGACRERLAAAERLSRRASSLLAELELGPAHPPAWRELEERAAARRADRRRRPWLAPSLAWAASIAIAFGVGWLSASYWTDLSADLGAPLTRRQAEAELDRVQPVSEAAPSPGVVVTPDEVGLREPDRALPSDAFRAPVAQKEVQAPEGRLEDAAERSAAPAEKPAADAAAPELEEAVVETRADRDRRESVATTPEGEAGRPVEVPPPAAPAAAKAELESRQRRQAQANEPAAGADRRVTDEVSRVMTEREAPEVPAALPSTPALLNRAAARAGDDAAAGFFAAGTEAAALWLGGELRTLPELRLLRTEVGPGVGLVGGLAGLPAVRLVYQDAAGHEITLIQQRERGPADAEAEPTLTIAPSGQKSYRWSDRGYLLTLIADVSSDSLRALAERVQ